jgi:hypothetical protein
VNYWEKIENHMVATVFSVLREKSVCVVVNGQGSDPSKTAILKASHAECNEGTGPVRLKNCNSTSNQSQILIFL